MDIETGEIFEPLHGVTSRINFDAHLSNEVDHEIAEIRNMPIGEE